mgnify:CR=1 FL=1
MYISNLYIICGAVLKTVYTINGFSSLLATSPKYQEQETKGITSIDVLLKYLRKCNKLTPKY